MFMIKREILRGDKVMTTSLFVREEKRGDNKEGTPGEVRMRGLKVPPRRRLTTG